MTLGLFLLFFSVCRFFFTSHRFLFVRNRNKGTLFAATGRHLTMHYYKAFIALTAQEIFWLLLLDNSCICITLKGKRYFPFHSVPFASPLRKTCADFLEARFI